MGDKVRPDVWVWGFNVYFGSLPASDASFIHWGAQGDDFNEGQLEVTSTGTIKWVRNGTNDEAETTGVVTAGAWAHIEVMFECEDQIATGILEIAINGNNEDFTEAQRLMGAGPIVDVTIGPKVAVGVFKIDDLYMIDTKDGVDPVVQLGETQISTLYPDGDGDVQGWDAFGIGTRWQTVAEGEGTSHDGDATYLYSPTTGIRNLFTFGDLDGGVTDVDVVAVNTVAKKNGLGGLGFHAVVKTGSTTVVDTGEVQRAAVNSYVPSQRVLNTDGESNSWTPANVDGSQFGVEVE
jgi:hypothetical protein